MRGPVPNQFPTAEGSYRIAIVGEAPGADECRLGYPFAGAAGWTLNSALSAVGLRREECLIANICQHRPGASSNDFSLLEWTGDEVQAGIAQLLRDLAQWPPHLVVCLGNVPLHLFRHGNVAPPRTPSGHKWPSKVTQWRGSLFLSHETLSSPSPVSSDAPCAKSPGSSVNQAASAQDVIDSNSNAAAAQAVTVGKDPCVREQREQPDHDVKLNRQVQAGEWPAIPSLEHHLTISVEQAMRLLNDCPEQLTAVGWNLEEFRHAIEVASMATSSIAEKHAHEQGKLDELGRLVYPRYKCLSTWHPAYVNRVWSKMFDLRQDMIRAREEGSDPALTLPELDIACGPAN